MFKFAELFCFNDFITVEIIDVAFPEFQKILHSGSFPATARFIVHKSNKQRTFFASFL